MSDAPERSDSLLDRDFDGHLERPFEALSVAERLWWLDETARFSAACRPFVPGGQGVLHGVSMPFVGGRDSGGDGVMEGELRLLIDDRVVALACGSPAEGGVGVVVAATVRRQSSGEPPLGDGDLSATPIWRPLIGQFVVLRYATIDRSCLAIEVQRDRAAIVIEAGAGAISVRPGERG